MKKTSIILASLLFTGMHIAMAQTKIIAHRGAWKSKGLPENSIASLKEAASQKLFGSEFDVHYTKDNVLVVNHNNDFMGIDIATSTYQELLAKKHPNGESIPTLKEYLEAGKKLKGMRLILELKTSKISTERTLESAVAVVKMVKELKAEKVTDYIAFSYDACLKLHELAPNANIQYLNSDKAPADVKKDGINGIDYYQNVFKEHPEWIKQANDLGMQTNVWTVNKKEDMLYFMDQGVQYITTNEPELLHNLITENK